jgi:hypothetical protein
VQLLNGSVFPLDGGPNWDCGSPSLEVGIGSDRDAFECHLMHDGMGGAK